MRHRKAVAKLGRPASHRKALMANQAKSMILHGKIKTTDAKAKELRRVIEKLITLGKKNTVHTRRQAYKTLQDRTLVKTLFEHIAPQYTDRNGGYTRITKLGFRDNDCASVSLIEFVDYLQPGEKKKASAKKAEPKKAQPKKTAAKKEAPKVDEIKKEEAEVVEAKPVAEEVKPEAEKATEEEKKDNQEA